MRTQGIRIGTREIRVGMRGIKKGMRGFGVEMREIGVGMRGTEWNRNRKKSEKKVYKIQFSFFPEIEKKKKKKAKFELS